MFSSQLGIMRMPHSLILFLLPADELIHPAGAKLAPLTYTQAAWRHWLRKTHVWHAKPLAGNASTDEPGRKTKQIFWTVWGEMDPLILLEMAAGEQDRTYSSIFLGNFTHLLKEKPREERAWGGKRLMMKPQTSGFQFVTHPHLPKVVAFQN